MFSQKLANFVEDYYVTVVARKLGQTLYWMLLFFFMLRNTLRVKTVSDTNSTGDIIPYFLSGVMAVWTLHFY